MYRALVWKVLLGMIPKSWDLLPSKMSNWWVIGTLSVRKRILLGRLLDTNRRAWIPTHFGNPGRRWLQHRAPSITLESIRAAVPSLFGARDWFHGWQFFPQTGVGRLTSGWFKYITFIVHFISNWMPADLIRGMGPQLAGWGHLI